jgi:hypothetical protein
VPGHWEGDLLSGPNNTYIATLVERHTRYVMLAKVAGKDTRTPVLRRPVETTADIVAKVFLGWRTKILRAADAFSARRREGPYRFIQNRSRTSVVALKSDAAAEKSKDQLWRDFQGCLIFVV